MAVHDIRVYPDPILKEISQPAVFGEEDLDHLVQDLVDTMYAAGHSVGVAAPQIGALKRVVVVDVSGSKLGKKEENHGLLTLINPIILEREGEKVWREGCMSVPDYTGNVVRAETIILQYTDRDGTPKAIRSSGFEAVAIQHELDHLNGYLFLDRVSSHKTDLFRRKHR